MRKEVKWRHGIFNIPIDHIYLDPKTHTKWHQKERLELIEDVKTNGITTPFIVKELGENDYLLWDGYHRLELARLYGYETVPCRVYYKGELKHEEPVIGEDGIVLDVKKDNWYRRKKGI